MFKLDFVSAKGDVLPLVGNSRFKLSHVDGITTASVEIASSTVASMDGDIVNNKRTIPRGIVLDLAIESDVENAKRYILQYIKPKQTCTLRMTQNDRETQIEGVVEAIDMPRFASPCVMQVTLYCSQPYWEDVAEILQDISEVIDMHYFTTYEDDMLYFPEGGIVMGEYDTNRTKVLVNSGDVEVGLEIHITALGTVTNPVIYNADGEFIGVNVTLSAGDEVIITTEKGKKTIMLNGENILSKIMRESTWLQLKTGENEFTIDSKDGTEGNMYFTLTFKQRYV